MRTHPSRASPWCQLSPSPHTDARRITRQRPQCPPHFCRRVSHFACRMSSPSSPLRTHAHPSAARLSSGPRSASLAPRRLPRHASLHADRLPGPPRSLARPKHRTPRPRPQPVLPSPIRLILPPPPAHHRAELQ
ncbi:hypothetical protein AcW1_006603 [Taiwanofungus camphoratus]|nr:hypothetical protein AcW1_006603 [Antrodia cinnamomea]